MSSRIDFAIPASLPRNEWDFRAIEYAFRERVRCGKNTIVLHTGRSSEGKSTATVREIEKFLEYDGLDAAKYINDVMVYTPLEYPEKLNRILYDKEYKDVNYIVLDDARFLINAKDWQSFLNRAIADVASVSRRVKPIVMYINTQFLKDIDVDFRINIDFWGQCNRPLHHPVEVKYYRIWLDESNVEHPKVRKRSFKGFLMNGSKKQPYVPTKFVFSRPSKEVWDKYEVESYRAKGRIIQERLNTMIATMKKKYGMENRVARLVEYYSQPDRYQELMLHFEYKYKKLRIKKESLDILGITKEEARDFSEQIHENFKKQNFDLGKPIQEKEVADDGF